MELTINTSNRDFIEIGINGDIKKTMTSKGSSLVVLNSINELINAKNIEWQDIERISFVNRSGSYTGLRVGASIAQALSWYLGIPVNQHVIGLDEWFISLNYSIDNSPNAR